MQELKINVNHKKVLTVTILTFTFYIVLFCLTTTFSYYYTSPIREEISIDNNEIRGIFFILTVLLFQNNAIVYMITLYIIYTRLSLICGFLEKLSTNHETSFEEVVGKLKSIAKFVDRISDTLDLMKVCYTIRISVHVVHFTFNTVLSVYGFISYFLKSQSTYMDFAFGCITLQWEIYYAPFFIWVFIFSNLIQRKGKRISMKMLQVLSKKNRSRTINKRTRLINMQLHHRRILIECGVFVVDWKLFSLVVSSALSYLLIIVQFEFKNV